MSTGRDRQVRFSCPHCGIGLKVSPLAVNEEGPCPKCEKTISARSASSPEYYPVVCGVCGTRSYATADKLGKTVECPDCFTDTVVTRPADPTPSRPHAGHTVDDIDEYRLRPDVDQPPPSTSEEIPVVCKICQTRLYARLDQVGQTIVCPDCETEIKVVVPSSRRQRRSRPEVVGSLYEVRAPEEVTRLHEEARQSMTRSTEAIEEEERKRPKPPRRPFLSGVLGFLLQQRIGLLALGVTWATMMVLLLVQGLDQMTPFMIPFACTAAALITLADVVCASVCFVSIVEKTANCLDKIDNWPEFDVMGWVLQSLYLIVSFALSMIPFVAVSARVSDYTNPLVWWAALPCFFVFPIILLSTLEEDSPLMPYSAVVWRSVWRTWRAWVIFYVESLAVVGIVALLGWGAWSIGRSEITPVFVFVCVLATIVYFRLLGRLAWVVGRESDGARIGQHEETAEDTSIEA